MPLSLTLAMKIRVSTLFGAIFKILREIRAEPDIVKSVLATNPKLAGKTSRTTTFVAVSAPAFLTINLYVTCSPKLAFGLLTNLIKLKSACFPPILIESLLFFRFGSNWSDFVIDARFSIFDVRSAPIWSFATNVTILVSPNLIESIFAIKIVPDKLKSLLFTKVKPSGK